MLDTTDALSLTGLAVIVGPILLALAMAYAILRRPTQPGEDNRKLSGAKVGVGAAIVVLAVGGLVYLFASNDPQRTTVTPTVERVPSTGIGPGPVVTPQQKPQQQKGP
jgi:hypothetical protein